MDVYLNILLCYTLHAPNEHDKCITVKSTVLFQILRDKLELP